MAAALPVPLFLFRWRCGAAEKAAGDARSCSSRRAGDERKMNGWIVARILVLRHHWIAFVFHSIRLVRKLKSLVVCPTPPQQSVSILDTTKRGAKHCTDSFCPDLAASRKKTHSVFCDCPLQRHRSDHLLGGKYSAAASEVVSAKSRKQGMTVEHGIGNCNNFLHPCSSQCGHSV